MLDCLLFMRKSWFQWGQLKTSKGHHTITYPINYTQFNSVIKSSAFRGSDESGEERYITWQNLTQSRIGCDVGGFNWFTIGV